MEKHIKLATFLAHLLDTKFKVGNLRFGIAGIIEFIPGIGDITDVLLSMYIVWIAKKAQIPKAAILQMVANIVIAFFIGLFPVVGDVGYILYKPNLRNLNILKQHLSG